MSSNFVGVGLGLAPADRHDARHLALRPPLHPPEQQEYQSERQQERQQADEQVGPIRVELDGYLARSQLGQVGLGQLNRPLGGEPRAVGVLAGDGAGAVGDLDAADGSRLHLGDERAVVDGLTTFAPQEPGQEHHRQQHHGEQPDRPARPALTAPAGPGTGGRRSAVPRPVARAVVGWRVGRLTGARLACAGVPLARGHL